MGVIKFRGWDENLKTMITPYCELIDGDFWGEDTTNTGFSVKHEHVMQFSGEPDKNGNEIYQSDIVTIKNKKSGEVDTGVVVAGKPFEGMWVDLPGSDWQDLGLKDFEYEVIGNLFSNPDLISK